MKRNLFLGVLKLTACLLLMVTAGAVQSAPSSLREVINFNREWKFQLGDSTNAESAAFDDAAWQSVGLPHSFSMPYFASPRFYVGYGWYRKHFTPPTDRQGRRVNLEFDGAFQVAEVFVNGKRVGEHKGGYTGFTFDITDTLKAGDNIVAVRVNNLWDARLAPRAGEHVFSGGIYRDVRLVATAPLHVAWYGTFVTTPEVTKESGTVNVKTEVVNDSGDAKSATVQTLVIDADGKEAARMESTLPVAAHATSTFDQTSQPVPSPNLWHPDHPYLYSVKTTVLEDGKAVDDFVSPLGFRWIKFTADQGFFINGEHYYFKGANVHQDHAGWGDAVADSGFYRDVKMVKDAGFEFIRGSHYPHAPVFASACDQLGILFWSENCFWGMGGKAPEGYWNASAYPINEADDAEFEASVERQLTEEIRIFRNHPSVIVWSMSNEPYFSAQAVMPKLRTFLKKLVALSHELDSTRPAAIGGAQRGSIDKLGDIAGYNGDGARLFINPGIPSVVTEYSSIRAVRPGNYGPGWGNLTQGPGDKTQPFFWRYPWRSGESLWCAFDHGSIAGDEGRTGIIDYFRLPKRQWFWYRKEYREIPPPEWPTNGVPAGLALTSDKSELKSADGTDDAQLIVTVVDGNGKPLSDSPPVKLAIESGPGEFPTGPSIVFDRNSDITIRDGQAAIEFRSYYAGQTVIRATSPGLKDATLSILTRGGPAFVPGQTPPVQPRPYVRFVAASGGGPGGQPPATAFGLNNPTLASSEAPDHPARFGNDGSTFTFWQAQSGATNSWWQVDFERPVTVVQTKLVFPDDGNYQYKIEMSEDGAAWTTAVDQSQTTSTRQTRNDPLAKAVTGHLLRVTFTGVPAGKSAALAEMEALGSLSAK
jgi:hypothetical protein